MKKMKAVLAVLITAGILAGCAGRGGTSTFEPKSSGIFVTDAGTFSTATVETYDNQDYYNEEEWKNFLEENVAAYNAEHGEGAVTLQTCSLKEGTASMIFDYATGSDLAQFTALYEDTANHRYHSRGSGPGRSGGGRNDLCQDGGRQDGIYG